MQAASDSLCQEYGLSVIADPRPGKSKHYGEWQAEQEQCPTWHDIVHADVDEALRQSMTERQFLENLRRKGYEVKNGKDISVWLPGKERFVRLMRNFGEEYSMEGIRKEDARFAKESYRVLKKNSHAYFFTRFDCYPHHFQCLRQAGFLIKNCLIVEKGTIGGIGDLRGSYANNAEWIIFCQKGRREFSRTNLMENKRGGKISRPGGSPVAKYKTRFNSCWFGEEYPKATYNSSWQKKNHIYHPTIKNVELLSWLIQLSSQPGELIFDGFMGMGSTALAALQNNRRYLGAEICPDYYETARKRIANERW